MWVMVAAAAQPGVGFINIVAYGHCGVYVRAGGDVIRYEYMCVFQTSIQDC